MSSYSRKPARFEEILKVLARTPFGRQLLEEFMPLLNRKKVRLEGYPAAVLAQLRQVLPEGQPIGAALVQDGKTGTIYFDAEAPLGVLAPFLAHEISHALNPRVWSGEINQSSRSHAESEVKAFEDQFRFTEELKARDPDFAEFLRSYLPRARILHQKMSLVEIEELYSGFASEKKAS